LGVDSVGVILNLKHPTIGLRSHLAWGDADAKTLYFTAVTGLYRLRVNVAGIRP
jgi:hypothetical protein